MKRFAIFTDSSCNLSSKDMEEIGIAGAIPMHFYLNGTEYDASGDWTAIGAKEYYDAIRAGAKLRSSQARSADYEKAFREVIEAGEDVLSISCTGALSGSIKESIAAAQRLMKEYPDAKIHCVDSCNCTYPLALLLMEACRQRDQGKTMEEVEAWIEKEKLCYNVVGTVDRLTYLRNAGRISASAAFFGGVFSVKPIVVNDELGNNVAIEKLRGRKASIERVADLAVQYMRTDVHPEVGIAHADCLEEAEQLAEMIRERCRGTKPEFRFAYVESGVGSSVGPGTLIVGFYGDPAMRQLYKK